MVLSEAAVVPSSSSLACLGWFQESVTSEKSCCGTGSNRARGSHPSILTSSRFMTHNKKQRLPAQHLACCENEDMDTALRSCADSGLESVNNPVPRDGSEP